jgi:hypothetical protein
VSGEEIVAHILLNCSEIKKWREELLCKKWSEITV